MAELIVYHFMFGPSWVRRHDECEQTPDPGARR
jgi:predicted dithiol-disulfide oxidoreductase (DUF899 family)